MEFKAAKCPNCGGDLQLPESIEVVKCMYCGLDIIVKEAIKNVKVENMASVENLIKMAESAAESNNHELAFDYYNKCLEIDYDNYEAWYARAISSAWKSTIGDFRGTELLYSIQKSIDMAPDEKKKELKKKASTDLNIIGSTFYGTYYKLLLDYANESTHKEYISRISMLTDIYNKAYEYNPDDITSLENIITINTSLCKTYTNNISKEQYYITTHYYEIIKKIIVDCGDKIREKDDSYVSWVPNHNFPSSSGGGGCYIATAVYGDYDASEVKTLRHFRDSYLMEHKLGESFIKVYYKTSPTFVRLTKDMKILNKVIKCVLDKFVNYLEKGK